MSESTASKSASISFPRGKRWFPVVIAIWLVVAACYLSLRPPVYEATAVFQLVGASKDSEIELQTIAEKMRRYAIHQKAFDQAGGFSTVEAFQKHTSVRILPRTGLIRLTVTASSEEDATRLATELIKSFESRESDLQRVAANNYRPGRILLVDPIYVREVAAPSVIMVLATALACGIVSALALLWLRDFATQPS